ncbi:Bug family tripartite tricarboxylate transporter substrate binding protein [Verticiella sediminum]|uniref:Bug family tripartite tricarboxylate transporter substrate binding protein n=1 Tax=Verticiella sediminum TaxID=1247510 RepID=UPI001FE4F6D5|nr:tripartite tricarboxylate transporter substrate binding protein [Verticiella sediminum]
MTRTFRRIACAIALAPGVALAASNAADYPERNVTMVVAFAPGGITDTLARLVASELGKTTQQTFVVENRPGAGGQIGTEYALRQKADGYTLLVAASGYAMAPAQKKVGYDPIDDFEPVALLGIAPNLLVVKPSVPAKTLDEFVAWAKKEGSVPYATAGTGGANHLAGEIFRVESKAPLLHVPYKGAAPATQDLIAGNVPAGFIDAMTIGPFIKSGQAKPIAITGASRSALYPDIPTIAESGYPGYDVSVWMGVFAPAGTPAPIVERLNAAIRQALQSEEVQARLKSSGIDTRTDMTADAFKQYVHEDVERWKQAVATTGVTFD